MALLLILLAAGVVLLRTRPKADPRFVGTWLNAREGDREPFATVKLRNDGFAELTSSKTGLVEYFYWRVQDSTFVLSYSYSGWLGPLGPSWNSAIRLIRRQPEDESNFEVLEVNDDSFSIRQTPKSPPIWFHRIRE
jgi:hypothetical protein